MIRDFKFFNNGWKQLPLEDGNIRPIDETYPEYYNTDDFVFIDVTEVRHDPFNRRPYKHILYRHIEAGDTVEGERIYQSHPMYNFPDVI